MAQTEPTAHQRLTRAGLSAGFADLVLERHAAELAEQIRENTRIRLTRITAVHGADWGRTWAQGRERAADLIDPEVKR